MIKLIKRLAKCVREYKLTSVLSAVFVGLEVVMEVLIPLEMANMIDFGINAGDMAYVTKSGVKLLIFALFAILFGNLAGRCCAIASSGFAKNIRHDMYYNIQNFSFSNIDKFSTSSLVTRMTTDVSNVQNAYQMLIRMAFRSPMMMIFSAVCAFRIYPKLAAVFVACLPVLMVGLCIIMTKTHPIFKRVFKTYDLLNQKVQENLRGIRVVKSFIREDHEIDKFEETSPFRFYKSGKKPCMERSAYAGVFIYLYDNCFMAWRKGNCCLRRRPGNRPFHRQPDESYHICNADTYERNDAFHGICYVHHCKRGRRAYM